MLRLVTLRTQLTILTFAVTLVALLAVLFYVTPQLESSLRDQKLRALTETARAQDARHVLERVLLDPAGDEDGDGDRGDEHRRHVTQVELPEELHRRAAGRIVDYSSLKR